MNTASPGALILLGSKPHTDCTDDLAAAEAEVLRLNRKIATTDCAVAGHDWQFTGGKNADCGSDCACSVPVHTCSKCRDCDYGDNEEARLIQSDCLDKLS